MELLKPSASGRPISTPKLQLALVLLVLVAAPGCDVIGAVQFYLGNEFSRAEWGASGDTVVLPINVTTHVSLPIGVNGSSPLRFVLDTGAPGIGIIGNSRTDAIGLKLGGPVQVGGSGSGNSPKGHLLSNIDLQIGEVELLKQTAVHLPWQGIPFFDVEREVFFDGIIGYDLLRRYVVELDFEKEQMYIHKPGTFVAHPDDVTIPMIMKMRKPFAEFEVTTLDGVRIPVRLHIDLGSRGTLSLIPDTDPNIKIPENAFRSDGMGLSGTVQSYAGRIQELRLGGYTLQNVTTKFHTAGHSTSAIRNGVIGLGVLRRFRVIFDYPEKQMILRATSTTHDPFDWDMTGARIVPYGEAFLIKEVAARTPAASAGLRAGDVLTSVDGSAVDELEYDELIQRLSSEPGIIVQMCVQRGNENHCVDLKLERRN